MLGVEILHTRGARTSRQTVERRVPFAQCDGVFFRDVGEKFAEAPDSALVKGFAGSTAVEPARFQRGWIESRCAGGPTREKEFQQLATRGATKILRGGIRRLSAGNAAEAGDSFGGLSGRQWL